MRADDIVDRMNEKGVCIFSESAFDAHCAKPSEVLAATGADPEYVAGIVRISFGMFTTDQDVDIVCGKFLGNLYELLERRSPKQ